MDERIYIHPEKPPLMVVFHGKGGSVDEMENAAQVFEEGGEYLVTGGFVVASVCYYQIDGVPGRWNSDLFNGDKMSAPVVDPVTFNDLCIRYCRERQNGVPLWQDDADERCVAEVNVPEGLSDSARLDLINRHPAKPPLPVVFIGGNPDDANGRAAAEFFEVGREYWVVGGLITSCYTWIEIEGVAGRWNSVLFLCDIFQAPVVTSAMRERLRAKYFPE